ALSSGLRSSLLVVEGSPLIAGFLLSRIFKLLAFRPSCYIGVQAQPTPVARRTPNLSFMRALVLSDIHGSLEGLEAALEAAGEVDRVLDLGDVVGYGASPNDVVEKIRAVGSLHVRGNHDRVAAGLTSSLNFNPIARAAALWTQEALSPTNMDWVRAM